MIRIEAHKTRKLGVTYIEDLFSQAEIGSMTPRYIKGYAEQHNNKICCCFNKLLCVIGKHIRIGNFNVDDFYIYIVDDNKVTHFNKKSQIQDWTYGYFDEL